MKKSGSIVFCLLFLIMGFGLTVPAGAALNVKETSPGEFVVVDTTTNLMWLKAADMSGAMTWSDAYAWADTLDYAGFSDWRLPMTTNPDPSCSLFPSPAAGTGCTASEMGHLFHISLGSPEGGPLADTTGIFDNIQTNTWYWSADQWPPGYGSDAYWAFRFDDGYQFAWEPTQLLYAWAVRVVPEPVSFILFITGGTVLGIHRLRKNFKK